MLTRAVVLPAPIETVWQALTAPDEVGRWFGARVEWDLRPGGGATFRDGSGVTHHEGVIEDVEPGRLLRFQWWPVDGEVGAGDAGIVGCPGVGESFDVSEVSYELDAGEGGTILTVTERRVADETPPEDDRGPGAASSGSMAMAAVGPVSAGDWAAWRTLASVAATTSVLDLSRAPAGFSVQLTAAGAVNCTETSRLAGDEMAVAVGGTWSVADEAALALWTIRCDATGELPRWGAIPMAVCCAR